MNENESGPRMRLAMGQGVALALIVAVTFILSSRQPQAAAAPTTYGHYVAIDKAFACDEPTGWKKEEAGGNGLRSGVIFRTGKAKIDIDSDLQGSLMADITRSSNAQIGDTPNAAPPKSPVEKLHEMGREGYENAYDDYEESAAKELPCSLGEARVSEWTAKKTGIGGGLRHGLRATVLSGERRVTVFCSCPERDWKALVPAFSRVLRSLSNGGA